MADKEYIEREALLKILNGLYDHHLSMFNFAADGATKDCIDAVIEAPTADVVPRKLGKWVYGVTMNRGWMKCDQCLVSQPPNGCFGYCPNCGAEMDGERIEK